MEMSDQPRQPTKRQRPLLLKDSWPDYRVRKVGAVPIIFGIKRLKKRLATLLALCGQCSTPAAQVVVRVSTWFSLFFIPVIPLGSKYLSTCTLCGASVKLDKVQAQQMVEAAHQVATGSAGSQAPPDPGLAPPIQAPAPPNEA
jgi:zinc-ribbon family